MNRKHLPEFWCSLHDKALASLGREFRSLWTLKQASGVDTVAFDDLVAWGFADRQDEPITKFGQPIGARIYYALAMQGASK